MVVFAGECPGVAEGDLNALTPRGHGDGHDEHPNA